MTCLWKYLLIGHNNLLSFALSCSPRACYLSLFWLVRRLTSVEMILHSLRNADLSRLFILSPYGAETRDSSWPSILAKHQSTQVHLHGHMCFQTAKNWRGTKSNVNLQKFCEESWLHLGICRIQRQADVKGRMFILATLLHWPDIP